MSEGCRVFRLGVEAGGGGKVMAYGEAGFLAWIDGVIARALRAEDTKEDAGQDAPATETNEEAVSHGDERN